MGKSSGEMVHYSSMVDAAPYFERFCSLLKAVPTSEELCRPVTTHAAHKMSHYAYKQPQDNQLLQGSTVSYVVASGTCINLKAVGMQGGLYAPVIDILSNGRSNMPGSFDKMVESREFDLSV